MSSVSRGVLANSSSLWHTYIVKGAGVGVGIVLEEEARDGSVLDLVTVGNFLPGHGARGERQGNR